MSFGLFGDPFGRPVFPLRLLSISSVSSSMTYCFPNFGTLYLAHIMQTFVLDTPRISEACFASYFMLTSPSARKPARLSEHLSLCTKPS